MVFEEEDAPQSVKINEIMFRKPSKENKMTNVQRIIQWCNQQKMGKIFKLSELLKETGLSNDSFKDTKKSNVTIRKLFSQMKTDKRGYYKIS